MKNNMKTIRIIITRIITRIITKITTIITKIIITTSRLCPRNF